MTSTLRVNACYYAYNPFYRVPPVCVWSLSILVTLILLSLWTALSHRANLDKRFDKIFCVIAHVTSQMWPLAIVSRHIITNRLRMRGLNAHDLLRRRPNVTDPACELRAFFHAAVPRRREWYVQLGPEVHVYTGSTHRQRHVRMKHRPNWDKSFTTVLHVKGNANY